MNEFSKRASRLGYMTLACCLAACAQNGNTPTHDNQATMEKTETGKTEMGVTALHDNLTVDQQVAAAVQDLAAKSGLAADMIKVVQARSVTWGSGAIGCPEPGKSYTMAVTPGILLILGADGKTFRYHGRTAGPPFYCPDSRAQAPAYGPGEEIM